MAAECDGLVYEYSIQAEDETHGSANPGTSTSGADLQSDIVGLPPFRNFPQAVSWVSWL